MVWSLCTYPGPKKSMNYSKAVPVCLLRLQAPGIFFAWSAPLIAAFVSGVIQGSWFGHTGFTFTNVEEKDPCGCNTNSSCTSAAYFTAQSQNDDSEATAEAELDFLPSEQQLRSVLLVKLNTI